METKICLNYTPGESGFYLTVPFDRKDDVKKIGGRWTQQKKAWGFPLDPKIWDTIRKTFGGQGDLLVAKSFLDEIARIKKQQDEFLSIKKVAEENTPIDYEVPGISLNGKNPLFNYQKWGIRCALDTGDGFLIGDVPGLGKSIQALGIALMRKRRGEISNCLIVCLASLKYNWLDEIAKFTREKALVVDGTKEERRQKWCSKGYFFKIANYETIVNDLFLDTSAFSRSRKEYTPEETAYRKYMQRQFDMVVVDEIHAIKHHGSQRTRALKQLVSKYRLGLSGTPVDGRLEELHSIYEYLKPGLFESRSNFMKHHAVMDMFGKVKAYVGVQEVREKILPYYIRRLKEKVLQDLPEKLYKDVYVELGKPEWKIYQEMKAGAHEITSEEQAATRLLRVRQFLDFPELVQLHNSSAKFLALAELLEELIDSNGDKVLIFTQYKQVLDLLYFSLKSRYRIMQIHGDVDPKERVEIVRRFNEGSDCHILMGTDAMGTGLNIGGANDVIHYEDNFSPAQMQQRNDRAHRATTRHNVTVYRFVCKGTIEENIRGALFQKADLNNRVLDENCTEFGGSGMTALDMLKYL